MNYKAKRTIGLSITYIILIALAIMSIYPALWIVMSSFNPGKSLFSSTLIPKNPTFAHYTDLFQNTKYLTWYWTTFKIAFFSMILSTVFVIMTAYSLSRFRYAGRKAGLMGMLVVQMFPNFMAITAIYILLLSLKLLDTHLGLILVYSGGAIAGGSWLVKGYFDTIPRSLEEAAKIDGASNTTIFLKVMLPLSKPIITFTALTTFIGPWFDFILARVVIRSQEKLTLAVGLFQMVRGIGNDKFTTFAAGAVLVALPITLLFIFLQRYLIEGLTAGATKG